MSIDDQKTTALLQELEQWERAEVISPYIPEMWRYTLSYHEAESTDPTRVPQPNEKCDAIPYVPGELARMDLSLSASSRVLDIGCLGGYGLYDLYSRLAREGCETPSMVGVDIDENSISMAIAMLTHWGDPASVEFRVMDAGNLEFDTASFNLVVARLLMPYVPIRKVLAEISRVMAPGAIAIMQLHGFRYYVDGCKRSLGRPRQLFYYMRPILSGIVYRLSGRQPQSRMFRETALEPAELERAAHAVGLDPIWHGGFRAKPIVALRASSR
jgi:SAM-dependent methyltransferase